MLEPRDGEVEDHAELAEEGGGADEAIVDSVRVAAGGVQPSTEAEGVCLEKRRQLTRDRATREYEAAPPPFSRVGKLECSLDSFDQGPLDDEFVGSQLRVVIEHALGRTQRFAGPSLGAQDTRIEGVVAGAT